MPVHMTQTLIPGLAGGRVLMLPEIDACPPGGPVQHFAADPVVPAHQLRFINLRHSRPYPQFTIDYQVINRRQAHTKYQGRQRIG